MRLTILLVLLKISAAYSQGVGIGTQTPDLSAILQLSSNSKGFLLPKVELQDTLDENTIIEPEKGLLIWNTSANDVEFPNGPGVYVNEGTKPDPVWRRISTSNSFPTLQDITNNGNQTSNSIIVNKTNKFLAAADDSGVGQGVSSIGTDVDGMPYTKLKWNADLNSITLRGDNISGHKQVQYPNAQIQNPTLTLSVNGNYADENGNIVVQNMGGQDLQQTTDVGWKTTNNMMSFGDNKFIGVMNQAQDAIASLNTIFGAPYLRLGKSALEDVVEIRIDNLASALVIQIPDYGGTINLPYSVDGNFADITGNIKSYKQQMAYLLDFPQTWAFSKSEIVVDVPQAEKGDFLDVSIDAAVRQNLMGEFSAWVSAPGKVTVRYSNYTNGALNPIEGKFILRLKK